MVLEIVQHTPKWVFALLVALVALGVQQARERTVRRASIVTLPLGMAIFSLLGAASSFGFGWMPMTAWAGSFVLSGLVLARVAPVTGVCFLGERNRVLIPGSWIPFSLMMGIFFSKYAVGATAALRPAVLAVPLTVVICSGIYGFFSGVFAARALSIWRASRPVDLAASR